MKRTVIGVSALALLAALSLGAAGAQGRGGFFIGARGGGLGLLRSESVQKELHMTQPQIDKADAKQQEMRQAMQQRMQQIQANGGFQALSAADRQKMFDEMQTAQQQAVADILDSTQLHRFNQLELQRAGASALDRKDVIAELRLSEAQQASMRNIQQQAMQEMRAAMQGKNMRDLTPQDRQQMGAARKATDEKMLGVLSSAQLKRWKQMQGAPFHFGPPPGRGGPGGAPGGGGR